MKIQITDEPNNSSINIPKTHLAVIAFIRPTDGAATCSVQGRAKVGEILTLLFAVNNFVLGYALRAIGVQVGAPVAHSSGDLNKPDKQEDADGSKA